MALQDTQAARARPQAGDRCPPPANGVGQRESGPSLTHEPAPDGHLGRLRRTLCGRPVRFDTRNLEEAQLHLHAQDHSIGLRVNDPAAFRRYSELQPALLPSVGLSLGCIDAASGYELSFQSRDEMLVNIPLRGRGWVSSGAQHVEMGTGQILLVGPSCHVVKHWSGPGQVLGLHIPLAALDAASGLPGARGLPLYLPPVALIDHARLQTLLGFIELLLQDPPGACGTFGGPGVAAHAERLLLAMLLEGLALNAPRAPASQAPAAEGATADATPYYVRRAESYIRAHASSELGIDQLAEAAGVSRRTLQYGFRKVHGSTPMLYVKRVRLEQARAALRSAAQQGRKVSEIAADIGCFNVSQFSRDYRAMFGESPSETAAAPRQLCTSASIAGTGVALQDKACADCKVASPGDS